MDFPKFALRRACNTVRTCALQPIVAKITHSSQFEDERFNLTNTLTSEMEQELYDRNICAT